MFRVAFSMNYCFQVLRSFVNTADGMPWKLAMLILSENNSICLFFQYSSNRACTNRKENEMKQRHETNTSNYCSSVIRTFIIRIVIDRVCLNGFYLVIITTMLKYIYNICIKQTTVFFIPKSFPCKFFILRFNTQIELFL